MNKKQRDKNRANAKKLEENSTVCPNCGERGKHWLVDPAPQFGGDLSGWVCPKLYGNDGRRLATNE